MKDKIKHYVIEEKDYTKSIFFFILHFFLFGGVYAGVVSLITYYMLTSGFEFTVEQSLFMSVSIWWLLYLIKLYEYRADFEPEIIKKVEHRIE